MNLQNQIYIDTVADQIKKGMYDHLFQYIPGQMVFLDIGANIGLVSKYFASYSKRIVALEPAPETFKQLQENTKDIPEVECYPTALAPVDAFVPFFINDINFTASSTVNTYGKQIMVEGSKLSTILKMFKLNHVDLCKVDAEGGEGESLDLLEIRNASTIIKTFYVETHNCPKTTWEHKLGTLVGNFARCGYTKMMINGMGVTATRP